MDRRRWQTRHANFPMLAMRPGYKNRHTDMLSQAAGLTLFWVITAMLLINGVLACVLFVENGSGFYLINILICTRVWLRLVDDMRLHNGG